MGKKQDASEEHLGCPLGFWVSLNDGDLLILKWNEPGEQFEIVNDIDPENIERFRFGLK